MNSIGKGHLWLDGSGRVSVPVQIGLKDGGTVQYKMVVLPDDQADKIRQWISLVTKEGAEADDAFVSGILEAAEKVRQDPAQLKLLGQAQAKAAAGAKRSRKALDSRILAKKKEAFKDAIRDLMDRGTTRKELAQLVKDAIVEGIYKS